MEISKIKLNFMPACSPCSFMLQYKFMVLQIPSFVKNTPTGKPSARLVESLSAFAARPANCWWWTLPGVYHFHPPFNGGGWRRRREACAYCHHETGGVRTDESGMYDESTRINGLKSRLDLSGGKLFSLFNGLPKVGSTRHHKTSVRSSLGLAECFRWLFTFSM